MASGAVVGAQSIDGLPASRFIEQRERFTADGSAPVDLTFLIAREASAHTARVVAATRAAMTLLAAWFGPLPHTELTVAGVPWRRDDRAIPRPDVVVAPLRWLTPVRDQSTERALIGGLVRQYWPAATTPAGAFEESLILYITARATDHLLEGSNFATLRFFGRIVPFSLRSVLLSPPVADPRPRAFRFDEAPAREDGAVVRGLRALQTIERYVGWPALLDALSRLRTGSSAHDAAALGQVLSETRGADVRFLVSECFRNEAVFDYAVADLNSRNAAGGLVETTVTIVRQGTGIFGTASGGEPSLPVRTRFADGSEVRDFVDGAAPGASLVYTSPAAAASATIDPDVMLVLDVNRHNNAIVRDAARAPLGIRLALNWMSWLQNTMLSYTAIL